MMMNTFDFDDELFSLKNTEIIKNEVSESVKKIKEFNNQKKVIIDLMDKERNINEINKILIENNFIFSWKNKNNESILYLLLSNNSLDKYKKNLIKLLILNDKNLELDSKSLKSGKNCLFLSIQNRYTDIFDIYSKYPFDIEYCDKDNNNIFYYIFNNNFDFCENCNFSLIIIQDILNKLNNTDIQINSKVIEHIMKNYREKYEKNIDFMNFFNSFTFDFNKKEDFNLFIKSIQNEFNYLIEKGFQCLENIEQIELKNIHENDEDLDEEDKVYTWISYFINKDIDEEIIIKLLKTNKFIDNEENPDELVEVKIEIDDERYNNDTLVPIYLKNKILDLNKIIDYDQYIVFNYFIENIVLKHKKVIEILDNFLFVECFSKSKESLVYYVEKLLEYEKKNSNIKVLLTIDIIEEVIDFVYVTNKTDDDDDLEIHLDDIDRKFNEELILKIFNKFDLQNKSNKKIKLSCPCNKEECMKVSKYVSGFSYNKHIECCKVHISFEQLKRIINVFSYLNYENAFKKLLSYQLNYENYYDFLEILKDNNRFLTIFVNQKKVKNHIKHFNSKPSNIECIKNNLNDNDVECVVCFENMQNSYIECSQCKQKVHTKCGLEWLKRNSNCMYCRTSIQHLKNKILNIEKIVFYEELKKLIKN